MEWGGGRMARSKTAASTRRKNPWGKDSRTRVQKLEDRKHYKHKLKIKEFW